MQAVTLQFYKYPRTVHWRHEMVLLGEDEHGTWLGAPPKTILQRGDEPERVWDRPFVQLIQPTRPWIPIFNLEPDWTEIYVDITTVPSRPAPNRVEVVDVDLDVVQLVGGEIKILDEDEFEEHRVELSYPQWLVDQARATTAEVVVAIETGRPPFDGAHLPWFQTLRNLTSE